LLPQLEDGPQTLRVTWRVDEWLNGDRELKPIAAGTCAGTCEAKFELLPADRPSVAIRRDPALADAVRQSLSARIFPRSVDGDKEQLTFQISVSGLLPVGIGFDVYARVNGKETKIGEFASPAGDKGTGVTHQLGANIPDFSADRDALVLKSNPDAAITTVDVFEIWDGEVVLSDIRDDRL